MPAFISKIQYTDSEIGEFFDEQERNLDTTIQLINNFPWQYQRRFLDKSITGPSVTIQNEQKDYLKVSIHYGSEFWILLLKNGRLYEYPIKNIFSLDEATAQVTAFFNNLIDISEYKLLRFELFAKRHFISKSFIYKPSVLGLIGSSWWYLFFFTFNTSYTIGIGIFLMHHLNYWGWLITPLIPNIILLRCIILIIKKFKECRNSYIQISETHNEFVFCDKDVAKTYYKTDIEKIITYSAKHYKSPNASFSVNEIFFRDGSFIRFNNLLYANFTVANKFINDIEFINKHDFKLKML